MQTDDWTHLEMESQVEKLDGPPNAHHANHRQHEARLTMKEARKLGADKIPPKTRRAEPS